jgi:hypothetical protein
MLMIELVPSPWVETFEAVVKKASHSLLICSPFVGHSPCSRISAVLGRGTQVSVVVLTDLSADNMLTGVTDVSALLSLSEVLPNTEVRFLPNLHAKVYVADCDCAVITSANLTERGLSANVEYGVYVSDRNLVRRVRSDILEYAALASLVEPEQLRIFQGIVAELRDAKERAERSARLRLRREFEKRLKAAQHEVLRVRAEGLSAHAAFADTILFVLRKGPRTTEELYTDVQRIHPDLCDDSVKLVIRGEVWNQAKWHHQVRHSQLFLRRQGKIAKRGGKWSVVA